VTVAGRDARIIAGIRVDVCWTQVATAAPGLADEGASVTDSAHELLTAAEFARYSSLPADNARTFLAGRRLLRELVATLADVDPGEVVIEARCPFCGGAHGRPAVLAPSAATALRLTLAHTGDLVVAAAAWEHPVGVDVESADARHAPERDAAIESVAGTSGADALQHWTRVEAVLKADGRGLRIDPSAVRVSDTADGVRARIAGSDDDYTLASLDLGPGFTGSVAVRS
jgi:4'-phosphopantetheinyl transferase